MAFEFRNTNIHLVLNNGGTTLHLSSDLRLSKSSVNISTRSGGTTVVDYSISPNSNNHLQLEPVGLGEDFIIITEGLEQLFIRVRVHQDFNKIWMGNESVTMYAGETNYFLSAFAEFDDGPGKTSIGDCSMHPGAFDTNGNNKPYVHFVSHDPGKFTLDSYGRITAVAETTNPAFAELFTTYKDDGFATITATGPIITNAMVNLIENGANYSPSDLPEVRVFGGTGTGVRAVATLNVSNEIDAINIVEGGTGYTAGDELQVVIYRRKAEDAKVEATVSGGGLTFNILQGGADYLEHPQVFLIGGDGTYTSVDAVASTGAVTGINIVGATGYTTAPQVIIKRADQVVPVSIKESLITIQQEIIESCHIGSYTGEKSNILILSDGFANKTDFERLANKMVDRLFSRHHQPYQSLKESFNVFTAFIPSDSDGITTSSPMKKGAAISNNSQATPFFKGESIPDIPTNDVDRSAQVTPPPVTPYTLEELIRFVGLPFHDSPTVLATAKTTWQTLYQAQYGFNKDKVDQLLFDAWKILIPDTITQVKDTVFGYGVGVLLTGRRESINSSSYVPPGKWYGQSETRVAVIENKRSPDLSPGQNKVLLFNRFLLSLKHKDGSGSPYYDISEQWSEHGKDRGLVFILLNSTRHAGARQGSAFASSIGGELFFAIEPDPTYSYKYRSVPNHVPNIDPNIDSTNTGRDLVHSTGVFAHEMCHSEVFQLLDEYENIDGKEGQLTKLEDIEKVDTGLNTTTLRRVVAHNNPSGQKQIDGARIKWNWHRIEQASVLVADAVDNGTNIVDITVAVDQVKKWNLIMSEGRNVILRTAELNPHQLTTPVYVLGDLKGLIISAINETTGVITLSGDSLNGKNFPTGSHLYLPLREGSVISGVVVENPGAGYTKPPTLKVTGGGGEKAKLKVTELVGDGLDPTGALIEIKNAGTGYTKPPKVEVKPKGKDAPTSIAEIRLELETQTTGILFGRVVNGGAYTTPPDIAFVGGLENGSSPTGPDLAVAVAELSPPTLTSIQITSGGSNYIPVPEAVITGGGGKGAKVNVTITSTGQLQGLSIDDAGIGYTSAPTITVPGGTTPPVISSTVAPNGQLESVSVDTFGEGYAEPTGVYLIIEHPTGKGARIRAVIGDTMLDSGDVIGLIIEQPGYGYNNTDLKATLEGDSNQRWDPATLTASFDANNGFTDPSGGTDMMQGMTFTPAPGTINFVYGDSPLKVIVTDKDGTDMGAKIKPTIDVSGAITNLEVLEPGNGYTNGVPPFKVEFLGGTAPNEPISSKAIANVVITPTLAAINVTNAGNGYVRIPEVTITPTTTGDGGALVAAELEYFSRVVDNKILRYYKDHPNAFGEKTGMDCDDPNDGFQYPPQTLGQDYDFKYPKYSAYTVGLYEGGGTWNCEAYKPSGMSIMKKGTLDLEDSKIEYHLFNYPSRYYMVSKVNPNQFDELDDIIQGEYNTLK